MAINLYAPASIFNTAIFGLDSAGQKISWLGLANNATINVTTYIPSGGSPYKYQVSATFGSGQGLQEAQEIVKKQQTFLSKISLSKPSGIPKLNKLPQSHEYIKPAVFKNEPKAFDPSGNVTGTYLTVNVPWPSNYKVYMSSNYEIASDGSILQFEVAADPQYIDQSEYTASFKVPDFISTGNVIRYTSTNTYSIYPSSNYKYNLTFN